MNNKRKIIILLCTYNGQRYLSDQLNSFESQSYTNWEVYASDDGSDDKTLEILNNYKAKWPVGRLSLQTGPKKGFAENFINLTCQINIKGDYYSYSDQDDIWDPDKLARAAKWLDSIPQSTPALYCSRTCLVDSENNEIGLSPLFCRQPSFSNALIQSIAGGNTMVFNNAARTLICEARERQKNPIVTHDWWVYILITGCGGKVFFDTTPTVRYRQHDGNIVGMNTSFSARVLRIQMLWQGRFQQWSNNNIAALRTLEDKLTPENRETLDLFAKARDLTLVPRLIFFKRSGIYRQTRLGNLSLFLAIIFAKI